MKYILNALIIVCLSSCYKEKGQVLHKYCKLENNICLEGKKIVIMETNKGLISIEIDGDSAPVTAGNFLNLVNRKAYDNTLFNRVIKRPFPYVIQGGKVDILNLVKKDQITSGLFINNLRNIPLEIKLNNKRKPFYNKLIVDPNMLKNINLRHQRGSISMARKQALNSAKTQFFIALKPLPELDGRYAVFGRVVKGLKVLDQLEKGDILIKMIALGTIQ